MIVERIGLGMVFKFVVRLKSFNGGDRPVRDNEETPYKLVEISGNDFVSL